jgi:hypothetical protein
MEELYRYGNTLPVDGSIIYFATFLWAKMILHLSNPVEGNKNGGAV